MCHLRVKHRLRGLHALCGLHTLCHLRVKMPSSSLNYVNYNRKSTKPYQVHAWRGIFNKSCRMITTHGNRMDVLEEELASVKACLIALRKEFDAHKNVRCPMSEEIKNHFKRMIERDEQTSERDPPPTYNLRSHVIDME